MIEHHSDNMEEIVDGFSSIRILVAGDLMLDRYIHGNVSRISPEAPVPIVKANRHENRLGGAGNVAHNIASIGGQAVVCGILGDDNNATIMENMFHSKGVDTRFTIKAQQFDTIVKTRVLGNNQQIVRIDDEQECPSISFDVAEIEEFIYESVDVLVISDYNKGFVHNPVVQNLIKISSILGKPTIVDAKPINYHYFKGASIITPNFNELAEFGKLSHNHETMSNIKNAAWMIMSELPNINVLCTRASNGMTYLPYSDDRDKMEEYTVSVEPRDVIDVSGAGDTVVSILSLCISMGIDIKTTMHLANMAAQVVIGKLGTSHLTRRELLGALLDNE